MIQVGKKIQVFELGPPQKYRKNYGMVVPNGSGREPLGTNLRKAPFQMIARIYWIFLLREAFLWHGLIHPHAGAYICKDHNI